MARTLYGGSPADVVAQVSTDDGDYAPATATMTAWDALAGGTQLTDLTTEGGSATSVVTPDGVGRVLFHGPDGYDGPIYLEDPVGTRWRIDPADLASRVIGGSTTGTVESVNGVDPDGSGNVALDADDIGDGSGKKMMTAAERTKLAGVAANATANDTDANLKTRGNHTGTEPLSALPTSVMVTATYSGGTAVRPIAGGFPTGPRCHWICTTAAVPPVVTTGTAGRYDGDIVSVVA